MPRQVAIWVHLWFRFLQLLDLEPVLKLGGVLRRGILDGAEAAKSEHPRSGL